MSLWLNVIWAAIQLALFVMQKIKESELISQGKAQQLQEILEQSNVLIQQIQLDRKSPLPGVAVRDEYDRDNDPKPIVADPNSMPVVLPSEVQQQSGQPADGVTKPAQQPDLGKPGV
jgi:hypothetical protein